LGLHPNTFEGGGGTSKHKKEGMRPFSIRRISKLKRSTGAAAGNTKKGGRAKKKKSRERSQTKPGPKSPRRCRGMAG